MLCWAAFVRKYRSIDKGVRVKMNDVSYDKQRTRGIFKVIKAHYIIGAIWIWVLTWTNGSLREATERGQRMNFWNGNYYANQWQWLTTRILLKWNGGERSRREGDRDSSDKLACDYGRDAIARLRCSHWTISRAYRLSIGVRVQWALLTTWERVRIVSP